MFHSGATEFVRLISWRLPTLQFKSFKRNWGCDPDGPLQTPIRASGPKYEKTGRKMDFGPTWKMGERQPKNGKMAIFDPFLTHFFGPCLSQFPCAPKIHF